MEEAKISKPKNVGKLKSMSTIGGIPTGFKDHIDSSDLPYYAKWPKGKKLNYEHLEQIWNGVRETDQDFDSSGKLELQLHGSKDPELCQTLSRYKLPNLRVVGLLSVVNQQPAVVQFLINSVPDQVEGMFISGDIFPPRPNFSDYI